MLEEKVWLMTQFVSAPIYKLQTAQPVEGPSISVVVPMYNEAENAPALIEEIASALRGVHDFEIVTVDDHSTDDTAAVLVQQKSIVPELRVVSHAHNAGQSRSVRTGILAAKGTIISTLDGDGQNNPKDIPNLIEALMRPEAPELLVMIAGERQKRQDTWSKKVASQLANGVRKKLIGDDANDSGCGLKVFYRDAFLRLPYFDHIHRYLPAFMIREGYMVEYFPVIHRARVHGQSKYTNLNRALVAIRDLMGVIWLKSRSRKPEGIKEL